MYVVSSMQEQKAREDRQGGRPPPEENIQLLELLEEQLGIAEANVEAAVNANVEAARAVEAAREKEREAEKALQKEQVRISELIDKRQAKLEGRGEWTGSDDLKAVDKIFNTRHGKSLLERNGSALLQGMVENAQQIRDNAEKVCMVPSTGCLPSEGRPNSIA